MAKRTHSDTAYSAVDDLNPWRPGKRQVPYASVAALLLSLVGILLSATILVVSDGQTLESWGKAASFTPSTYLSIASTVTNITLHFALSGGITVSWWRRALLLNSQVVDLHRTWSYGNNFFAAITSWRNFNLVALASILVTLAPINGPLLQRASRVTSIGVPLERTIAVQIAARLPQGYTGYMTGRTEVPALLTAQFANVVRSCYRRDNIPTNASCEGICNTHVLGAGWSVTCDSSTTPYNMSMAQHASPNYPVWTQVFDSNFRWQADLPAIIQSGASSKTQNACTGNLVLRNCTLIAATVKYPVIISSGTIALDPSSTIWDDVVVGPWINGSIPEGTFYNNGTTTYGGIQWALSGRFQSSMLMMYEGPNGYEIISYGELASAYATNVTSMPACDAIFTDPMDDMLQGARELTFRAAIDAAQSNNSMIEYVVAAENETRNIYRSNYLYFGIATALSVLSIIGVVGTFNGFWILGRSVSLSPIETAKAFNPSILSNNDSNATIGVLLEEVGKKPIRYGCVGSVDTFRSDASQPSRQDSMLRRRLPKHGMVPTSEDGSSITQPSDIAPVSDSAHEANHAQEPLQPDFGFESGLPVKANHHDEEQPFLHLQLADPALVKVPEKEGRYTGYHHLEGS